MNKHISFKINTLTSNTIKHLKIKKAFNIKNIFINDYIIKKTRTVSNFTH